ncbi:hypothetical protein [Alkalitalea saponilacus]|nr:hypothetical protein [Alkalitalea saponilacus]
MLLIGISIALFSCEKQDDSELDDIIIGRDFDPELLGTWAMNSTSRDYDNANIFWIDSIHFGENNIGKQRIYQFSELEREVPFQYYTDNDNLFIFRNNNLENWIYEIKNDSLTIVSIYSIYISYSDVLTYLKSK